MTCTRRAYSVWTTCRCDNCRRDMRRLHKRASMGRYTRPSSAQATIRVIRWLRDGYTPAWIASACDVPRRFIEDIERDFRRVGARKIGPRRAGQILAADIHNGTAGYGPADEPRDMLRALATLGHGLQEVSDASGVSLMTLSVIRSGKVTKTGPGNIRAVRDAFRELARKPGPAQHAAKRARALGWPTVIDLEDRRTA